MTLLFLFLGTESKEAGVLSSSSLGSFSLLDLKSSQVTLALQNDGSDETLNLGGLDGGLLTFLLGGDDTFNDVFADIIILGQVEELTDLGSTLRTETTGNGNVSKTGKGIFTLLGNDDGEDSEVSTDDTTTDGFALTFTSTTGTITGVTLGEEQTNTVVQEDTLFHGETLLIVTTSNLHDVTLEFFTKSVSFNFLRNTLIIEDAQFTLISNFNKFLTTSGRISDINLLKKAGEYEIHSKINEIFNLNDKLLLKMYKIGWINKGQMD
jgi:hypothetical protein